MRKKIMFIILSLIASVTINAQTKSYDWSKLIDAIAQVESGGNPKAKGGSSVGILQITPMCVAECNSILAKRGEKKRYTLNDRWDVDKSKEMFILIQSEHNKTNDIGKATRIWNGGAFYDKIKDPKRRENIRKKVDIYHNKVMKHYKK